jgi:2-methylcitrate dehydratase PrpD
VKALTRFAEFVQGPDLANLPPARFDRLKLHVIDASGARLAGSRIDEGAAVARLAATVTDGITGAILAGCAQTRCTEVDDIHLTSCTTPGSVIVPTVLALAADGDLRSVHDVSVAALAGCEALIRLGVAIDGPAVLRRSVWPTHVAAAFGSAAAACRTYGLSVDRTAGALATALAFGSGRPVAASLPASSRWTTLGVAAVNGLLAARAAREGLLGTADTSAIGARLTKDLGRRFLFDDIGTKPYPTARQGLAAIEAARQIADAEQLDPSGIDEIIVRLPEAQRAIVDHPAPPVSRFASIVSVQYQIALALIAPAALIDVRRTPPLVDRRVRMLMSRIRVQRARDLDTLYPRAWPARVEVTSGGRRYDRLVRHPRGDARNPFGWDEAARKFTALAAPAIGEATATRVVAGMRIAGKNAPMLQLWDLR